MNGDILKKIDKKIEQALEDKRLGKATRSALEVQSLFITFLKQSQEDHIKVEKMYLVYRLNIAAFTLLGGSVFSLVWGLLTDKIHIVTGAG